MLQQAESSQSPSGFGENSGVLGGRPNHSHWHGFMKKSEKGKTVAQCIKCNQFIRNTAIARMQSHRRKCPIESDVTVNEESDVQFRPLDNAVSQLNLSTFTSPAVGSSPHSLSRPEFSQISQSPTSRPQPKISQFFRKISKTERYKLDLRAAKFFFACNVPFVAASNKYFKDFCNEMQPSYTPPSRKRLAGPLLDAIHKEQIDINAKSLDKASSSVLLIDGWKNSAANTKNIAVLLHNCDHRIFLESYDFSDTGETSENLIEVVNRATNLAKERYDVEIFAVVTDNAPNMVSMGRNVGIIHTTCNAHIGNLLSKDIIRKCGSYSETGSRFSCVSSQRRSTRLLSRQMNNDFYEDQDTEVVTVLGNVHKILNEFKKVKLEKKVVMLGGTKPKLPCRTRWCSERDGLSWLINNLSKMKQISALTDICGKPVVKADVSELLYKEDFIHSVQRLLDLLNPVAILIKNCQKSDYSIADSTEAWIDLLADASTELYELTNCRCEQSKVFNKYSLTANFLHPLYRGAKLTPEQLLIVEDFILEKLDEDGLVSYSEYKRSTAFFSVLAAKTIKPDLFWNMAQSRHNALASFALKLLMIPASTAQLEGIFSNWSHVHSDLRNRLATERSKKLLEVYFSLKISEKKDNFEDIDDRDSSEEEI